MSQQYNKVIKRQRRVAYLKRKKAAAKTAKAAPPAAKREDKPQEATAPAAPSTPAPA